MNSQLTKKQALILDFIRDYKSRTNQSPSYREIMSALGIKSVSAVAEHVDNLIAKGALRKTPGTVRSLELVEEPHPETAALFRSALLSCTAEHQAILLQAAEILGLHL